VYFDNVGGEILDAALMNIKDSSRIVLCGSVSTYYGRDEPYKLKNYPRLIIKRCTMEGFIFFDYAK
jgi:NADPH-dependent curcumin reductase CurA